MSVYIFDTNTLTHFFWGHPPLMRRIFEHLNDDIVTTTVNVDETLSGWQTVIKHSNNPTKIENASRRLAHAVQVLGSWEILPLTASALRRIQHFDRHRHNVGVNDLRIAAIAMEADATLVTANRIDFSRVPGLRFEDWIV